MNYTRESFYDLVLNAIQHNTFLTPKHDPNDSRATNGRDHTVVSHEVANNLQSFFEGYKYDLTQYDRIHPVHGPIYFVVKPHADAGFTITGSGVTQNAITNKTMNRLIIISGRTTGVHVFAEKQRNIKKLIRQGKLTNKRDCN